MITGGEPMMYPERLETLIDKFKLFNPKVKLYLYTANPTILQHKLLHKLDGFTLGLHRMTQAEANYFSFHQKKLLTTTLEARLKIYPDMKSVIMYNPVVWDRVTFEKHNPSPKVPDGEVYGRLRDTWL